jgi:ligand-binding SRPBCC domain-containing protein
MEINIETKVDNGSVKDIFQRFDEKLFLKLAPPFPKFKLLRFDGCQVGDLVEVELVMPWGKEFWQSTIIDFKETETEIYFIDQGTILPSFLSQWKHIHRIKQCDNESSIISDEISMMCKHAWQVPFIYPGTYFQMMYRKNIYKRMLKI